MRGSWGAAPRALCAYDAGNALTRRGGIRRPGAFDVREDIRRARRGRTGVLVRHDRLGVRRHQGVAWRVMEG